MMPSLKVYTFYDSEDLINPNVCILMNSSGMQSPVLPCNHCTSGPGRYLYVIMPFHQLKWAHFAQLEDQEVKCVS